MTQSKNLKLKLGLCGLALTSFLALNNRANTVHADTVDANQNNAITWDSDQDDSQVVKNETQQSQPTQNVQTKQDAQQAPVQAEQKQSTVQSQQRIFQSAPKQATVQSNVQNRQSQPNVAVANVSSTQAMPNRAEKSIVRQSNVETSTVNRLNADSAYNNQANVSVKVANLDATIPTRITNPQNNQVKINYVDLNGHNINQQNIIKVDHSKSGAIAAPTDRTYQLAGDANYTVSAKVHSVAEASKASDVKCRITVQVNTSSANFGSGDVTDQAADNEFSPGPNLIDLQNVALPDNIYQALRKANITHMQDNRNYLLVSLKMNDVDSYTTNNEPSFVYSDVNRYPEFAQFHKLPLINMSYCNSQGNYDYNSNHSDGVELDEYGQEILNGKGQLNPMYASVDFDAGNHVETFEPGATSDSGNYYAAAYPMIPDANIVSYNQELAANYTAEWLKSTFTPDLLKQIDDNFVKYHGDGKLSATDNSLPMPHLDKDAWLLVTVDLNVTPHDVVDSSQFTAEGGAVKGSVGNVLNVAVTKPQNVDPNSSDCRRQAQRVIHVTFPNDVKPKSYDSITDSAGNKLTLDGNNDLVQTVTFTRSKTVDSLTGATLNQTSWQQHGSINAVTLPSIPGYTMVTNTK